jgi:hypothetical protein
MENKDAIKDSFSNQNMIITICFTISGGGIAYLFNLIYDKSLSYSLIPIGIALISWILSIVSGLVFLVKRGNNSARASSGEQVPLHSDYDKAPKYIKGQLCFLISGMFFMLIWLVWHLLINTYSWFPK